MSQDTSYDIEHNGHQIRILDGETTSPTVSTIKVLVDAEGAVTAALQGTHDAAQKVALQDILDRIQAVKKTAAAAGVAPIDASGQKVNAGQLEAPEIHGVKRSLTGGFAMEE